MRYSEVGVTVGAIWRLDLKHRADRNTTVHYPHLATSGVSSHGACAFCVVFERAIDKPACNIEG
jgi:hypothetical protein